jgi:excisionase family DNA binding protein
LRSSTLTLQEVAERLGVHYMTAYRYVRTGRLPAVQERGEWRVARADVDNLQRAKRSPRGRARRGGVDRRAVRDRFERCIVRGDEPAAWQVIEDAMTSGASPSVALVDIVVAAMHDVGDGWASGRYSIAQEHAASAVAHRVVGRLGPRFARRGRSRGTAVVGVVGGDPHALGVHALADLLRGVGLAVRDLGGDVPAESFVEAVAGSERLLGVGIGAYTSGRDAALRRLVRALRTEGCDAPIIVGGTAIDGAAAATALRADAYGATLPDACQWFADLVDRSP